MRFGAIIAAVLALAAGCSQPRPAPSPTPAASPTPAVTSGPPTPTPVPTFPPVPSPTTAPTRTPAPSATPGPAPTSLPPVATLTIAVRTGLKWSDGSPLTAHDVAGTYEILWALDDPVWSFLRDVVVRDDRTVEFAFSRPAVWAAHAIMRQRIIAPRSQYGWLMEQAVELRRSLTGLNSPERHAFLEALLRYSPGTPAVAGPFRVDPANSAPTALALARNPAGYAADQVDFLGLTVYSGDALVAGQLYASGEIDYAATSLPAAALAELRKQPTTFVGGGRSGVGPGLWFNHASAPLDRRDVRQAIAFALNRDAVRLAAVAEGGATVQTVAGFPDGLVERHLPADVISRLVRYAPDTARSEALLRGMGWSRGADGRWRDGGGTALGLELAVPEEYADWMAAAESIRAQLTAFGIGVSVKPFPAAAREDVLRAGAFQLLIDIAYRASPPHPVASLGAMLAGLANDPEAAPGARGMDWAWRQQLPGGGGAYVPDLLAKCGEGLDLTAIKPACASLALLFNAQLPVLPLWETLATDLAEAGARAVGWLPREDKAWRQNPMTDNYAAEQLLEGALRAAPANRAKQFNTYQPLKPLDQYSSNPFAPSFLGASLGPFVAPLVHPPLFWYNWADAKYEPMLAERFDIR